MKFTTNADIGNPVMNQAIKTTALASVFAFVFCLTGAPNAEAGNSWRWAQPLNKKAGSLLYTTNRNTNNSFGARSKSYRQANTYSHGSITRQPVTSYRYAAPLNAPPIQYAPPVLHSVPPVIHHAPQTAFPVSHGTVIHGPVIHSPVTVTPQIQSGHAVAPAIQATQPQATSFNSWLAP